jgi:hypothetical protein
LSIVKKGDKMDDKQNLYIGKEVDLVSGELKDKFFYKTKDLSTHAVILGMTGSGKTGMAIATLEEAILDGIPVIAIDPKGDLTNLLLTFPGLKPEDFKPWIDPDQAEIKGISVDMYAENIANTWQKGLKDWEITPERLQTLKDIADYTIFTPGSTAGIPVSILQSFKKPEGVLDQEEILEKIKGITTALLGLLGIEADPVKSREHILISTIIQNAWQNGKSLSIEDLIMQVQKPPFEKLGVFTVDSFFPKKERTDLGMQINSLIASPTFQTWLSGVPFDINSFLKAGNKSRVSIFYIAHLAESERMFFVTLLLQEVLSWMRMQPGTDTPRVILYFDEIFGYFPPHPKDPPSKYPLLTLMKQARAFGLSVILATQNPVDLDYKGLTNAGTWFIGKLQQENDKERVMSGLEGTLQESGKSLDKSYFDKILGMLKPRIFLVHNVHSNEPKIISSRWVMNYLRGPLTKTQVADLMKERKGSVKTETTVTKNEKNEYLPEFPEGVPVMFELNRGTGPFVPYIYMEGEALYQQDTAGIYFEKTFKAIMKSEGGSLLLESMNLLDNPPATNNKPPENATFADIPGIFLKKDTFKAIQEQFKQFIKGSEEKYYYSPHFKLYSRIDESNEDFINRIKDRFTEVLKDELQKLRDSYSKKLESAKAKIRTAESQKEEAEAELRGISRETGVDIGTGVLSILMGRSGRGSIRRATSSATRREKAKIKIDKAALAIQKAQLESEEIEKKMDEALREKEEEIRNKASAVEEKLIRPNASSVAIKYTGILFR